MQRSERRPRAYGHLVYGVRPPGVPAIPRSGPWRRVGIVLLAGWLAVVPIGLMTQPARALFGVGDVVFDPANFGEAIKSVAETAKTVAQITQLVTVATRIVTAFGEGGPIAGLLALGGAADQYGLLDGVSMGQEAKDALKAAGDGFKAGGSLYNEVKKLGGAAVRLDQAIGQAGAWSDNRPRFPGWDIVPELGHYASTTGSRSFSYEFLSAWAATDPGMARVVEGRSRLEREIGALELHGVSLFNGYGASRSAERNRQLLQQAQNATNSRSQQAAQLAATMALLEEIQKMNMQLAAQGRFQSAQYLGSRSLVAPGGASGGDRLWMNPKAAEPTNAAGLAQVVLPPENAAATP